MVANNGIDCINMYQNEYQIRRSSFRKPLTEQNAKVVNQDNNQSYDISNFDNFTETEFDNTLDITIYSLSLILPIVTYM